jgi:hypothetical protein
MAQWRVSEEKLNEIIVDPETTINAIEISSNNYRDFLFLTASRGSVQKRTCMTFWGLGFHEYRDRWIHQEWFWHQTPANMVDPMEILTKGEVLEQLQRRREEISQYFNDDEQSEIGKMFEELADMADDDAALTEMQDLGVGLL